MRLSIALVACICTLAAASSVTWDKQKLVLDVFQHASQYNMYPKEFNQYVAGLKWENYADKFGPKSKDLIAEVNKYYSAGLFNFKRFFVTDKDHMKAAELLYRTFYYAQDWETFRDMAIWARVNLNPGLFGYAFSLAIIHRADMQDVILPATYEIYPHFYYGADVMDKVDKYRLNEYKGEKYEYFVPANYTSVWYNHNEESLLAYFTEDVSLASYHYYAQMDLPEWLDFAEYDVIKSRRGELYLYQIKNLLSRYYMERLSNNLGSIPEFSFYEPIATGYNSMLRYYNGAYFPVRNDYYNAYTTKNYYNVDTFEMMHYRIREAIDLGYIQLADGSRVDLTKPESIDILGNLIQANPQSVYPRYFKSIEKLGFNLLRGSDALLDGSIYPSPLEWTLSAVRDPMFYQFYKKLMYNYWTFKDHLPYYTDEELIYDNVKFESAEISKLTTYFDEFVSDITNAAIMDVFPETVAAETAPLYNLGRRSVYKNHDLYVKGQQMRLNHDHFSIKLKLNAVKEAKVLIKTFLGPKTDEFGHAYTLNEMRENFFEVDEQIVTLAAGSNSFERHCSEFPGFAKDRTTYYHLYEQLMLKDTVTFPLEKGYRGFPGHLMLPKGWKSGMPVQFFFYVMPFVAEDMESFDFVGHKFAVHKHQSFGFPLDRPINEYQWKQGGNWYFYDTVIYHK